MFVFPSSNTRAVSFPKRSAFGLLELLVSVAVIVILLVLGIGYSGQIRQQANAGNCVRHLRQVGALALAYASDHQQQFPAVLNTVRNPPDSVAWMHKLRSYAGYNARSMGAAPLPRAVGIFYCPSLSGADRDGRRVGYFYNAQISSTRSYRITRLLSAPTFLIVEGSPANIEAIGPNSNAIAYRHRGSANVLFADGHVVSYHSPISKDAEEWGARLSADSL